MCLKTAATLAAAGMLVLAVAALIVPESPAQTAPQGTTVIVECEYTHGPGARRGGFATRVAGAETAGPRDVRIDTGMSCADAFNLLFDLGFTLMHAVAGDHNDGIVNAVDYSVWRDTLD